MIWKISLKEELRMARRIKKYGGKQKTFPVKSKRDLDALLNYFLVKRERAKTAIKKEQADRNWFFFLIGINTAFRAEDLLQLRVRELEDGYVHIKENKTGKVQNFRLNRYLYQDIKDFIERNNLTRYDYFFASQKQHNCGMTKTQANRILKAAAEAVKLKQSISLHSLRKTFGYHYILNGGNILTLMKMYNHDDTRTTELYICWGTDDAENERSQIYLGGHHRKGIK